LLSRPAEFLALEILALIAAGLLILGLTGIVRAQWTLLLFVVLAGGFAATSWWLFTEKKMLLDAALPAAGVFLVYSVVTYASYAREEASKRQVRDAFGRYLSPALVEQLADNPDKLRLGGEMRPMTLMFSDVRGFTTISETFKSNPEGLTRLINRFLSPTTNVILQHRGTIDKYMGDAIMAFWNAPLDDAGHAANACRAALAMFIEMDKLNAELNAEAKAEGREAKELHIGIGINSGICCVGNMGSHQRFDYSVLGDTVNLASRLEGQSKTYHVGTVVGEGARNLVQDMAFLELDLIAVKGKKEAVRIFTLLGDRDVLESSRFQAVEPRHAAMLVAFRGQKWDEAKALCAECAKLWPDLAEFYGLYLERIAEYEANPPPPNWDGVFVATSK
ncbi:MAG: adenylate/guanylate cyclase domain-containing protein, partial [Alphaproteobacteria bacterium]|nr:adenylate/guanylate cyclase domain-containing protein [Alphaproteobacteria bacterium]